MHSERRCRGCFVRAPRGQYAHLSKRSRRILRERPARSADSTRRRKIDDDRRDHEDLSFCSQCMGMCGAVVTLEEADRVVSVRGNSDPLSGRI